MATSEQNLRAFSWLPLERWTERYLLSDPVERVAGQQHCNVCSAWVKPSEAQRHARAHREEMMKLRRNTQKQSIEKAQAARKEKLEAEKISGG